MFVRIVCVALALTTSILGGCSDDEKTVIVEGEPGPPGPPGPPSDEPATAVETCVGCHGPDGVLPVADVETTGDAHFVDTDPDGPLTAAGYRSLDVALASVDVTGTSLVLEFDVTDEDGVAVVDLFASDGRFTIARLQPPAGPGQSSQWLGLITRTEDPGAVGDGDGSTEIQVTAESFSQGSFENLGGGSYRYTSTFDPTSVPVEAGDTIRVAIQISAGDLPAANGWCDFDADLGSANDCASAVSLTRDIVQTSVCNTCHGVTSDTRLALHGGGRTRVEYCVTCHNPTTTDANSDNVLTMTTMIHKIHRGAALSEGYRIWGFRNSLHDYSGVNFTKDIDDCTTCHTGGGADVENWNLVPTREACGSCHDDVNFATGENHAGGSATSDEFCSFCHPSTGAWTPGSVPAPVQTVHQGVARRTEAERYAGAPNGFAIVDTAFDAGDLTIDYSVTRSGIPMDLVNDPEWTAPAGASRLALTVGWTTADYTNEGASAPANPVSVDALDVGGAVTELGGGVYRTTVDLPSESSGTVTVSLEGHPAADLVGTGTYDARIPVVNVFEHVTIEGPRSSALPRRRIVDIARCNDCHDAAGQGISLHGNNRTGNDVVCAVCHNPNNTDVARRPADPSDAIDGKAEVPIDFKRMIHQIHAGVELEEGLVVYGFGGSANDFADVQFIGNLENCETCHLEGTYGAAQAADRLPTTVDTGDDLADPADDLNISPIASACSSCHDSAASTDHMELHGAAFRVLDENVE